MTTAEAMIRLDALVAEQPQREQYAAARTLYAAARAGLLPAPIPPRALYAWVLKWATIPDRRGRSAPVEIGEPDHGARIRAAFVRGREDRRRSRS